MNVSPGSEHASGSEYANILDILEFWICVRGSEYTRDLNISGLHRALNVRKYFFDMSDHVWICLNMAKYAWIFLNILEYAQIYVNCFCFTCLHLIPCLLERSYFFHIYKFIVNILKNKFQICCYLWGLRGLRARGLNLDIPLISC